MKMNGLGRIVLVSAGIALFLVFLWMGYQLVRVADGLEVVTKNLIAVNNSLGDVNKTLREVDDSLKEVDHALHTLKVHLAF